MSLKVQKVTEPVLLGEGPHWDARQQALFFVDILPGAIHKYVPATGDHTKTKLGGRVGFIVPVEGTTNQFVVGFETTFRVIEWDGAEGSAVRVVKDLGTVDEDVQPQTRFNDGKADPRGRLFAGWRNEQKAHVMLCGFLCPDNHNTTQAVAQMVLKIAFAKLRHKDGKSHVIAITPAPVPSYWNTAMQHYCLAAEVGTMGYEEPLGNIRPNDGSFYRLDERGIMKLCSNIGISNGLAWDLAEKAMYYTDSPELKIRRYDYDVNTGEISNMSYAFDLKKNGFDGFPDGSTIDTDGNLWVAVFNGSCVIKLDPRTGQLLQKVPIPALQVTSVTFGGPNYDVLFVTTASMNINGPQEAPCGATFMVTGLGVKGHPNVNFKLP